MPESAELYSLAYRPAPLPSKQENSRPFGGFGPGAARQKRANEKSAKKSLALHGRHDNAL